MSLYEHARVVRVADGESATDLCAVRLPALAATANRRIVLVHGNPSCLDHWRMTTPALQQLGEVLAYDAPGFGQSAPLARGEASLERSARLALALLDAEGWDAPVDLVGHSHGGMVALTIAALAPHRVARIVVFGTGGTPAHPAYRLLALPGMGRALLGIATTVFRGPIPVAGRRWMVHAAAGAAFQPDAVPAEVVDVEMEQLTRSPAILQEMARHATGDPCARVAVHGARVQSPALFIHGTEDAVVPIAYARRLFALVHRASPASRFVERTGGHMVHYTQPAFIAAELADWLR